MANSSNGRLWFTAGIDRSELSKGVTAINRDFAGLQTNAGRTGSAFSDMWKTAAAGVGAYLSATAALDMGQQIINLTRQRELMEKSFEVLFGGADAARQKIDELRDYAIITPYTFENLTKGAQTLSAFGFSAEEIMPNLKLLADVAAGNNERFERLSLVFAQTQSAGKLMGQDLLQYVNAGFNPLQVISEKTGKSVSDLRKEMENGAISAEMVVDAFKTATSEGGKFYGMTEKMADSIEAAKTNFESAWVEKQIEWGNAAKDNIKTMYEFGSTVVENADDIAKTFAVLITAVGSYKAALIALGAIQSTVGTLQYTLETAELQKLVASTEQVANADLQAAVAKGKLSEASAANISAIRAEVAAKLDSLNATAAVAAAEVDAANATLATARASNNAAIAKAASAKIDLQTLQARQGIGQLIMNQAIAETAAAKLSVEQSTIQLSIAKLSGDAKRVQIAESELLIAQQRLEAATTAQGTAQTELQTAKRQIAIAQEKLHAAQKAKLAAAEAVATAQTRVQTASQEAQTAATAASTFATQVDTVATKSATTAKTLMAAASMKVVAGLRAIKLAVASNPIGFLITVLSTAAMAWQMFRDNTNEAKTALEEFNEEQEKSRGIANDSISTIQDENATMYQKVKAYEALTKASRALTAAYTLEQLMSGEITQSQIAQILNTEKDAAEYKMLTDNVESARKKVEQYQELLSNQGSVGTAGGGSLTYSIGLSRAQKELKEYEASLAEYNKTRAEATRLEAESLRKSGITENIRLLTDEKTTIEARTEAYEALKTLSPELTEMYGEEAVALMTLAQAQEAAANAEELAALRKQQTSVQSAISALPASTGAFDIFASTREDLELQAESIAQEINKVLDRELTPTTKTPLTAEQLKALEKEAEARRKMYEQGLLDYETFQQGVERLAQEHATRVAAYEAEATSPEQLTQLTAGSEAQMAAEIEALHEKHETERYLALEAAREQIEINNDRIAEEWEAEEAAFDKRRELQAELLSTYSTYQQKRDSLTQEYEANRAAMFTDDSQTTFAAGFNQGDLDNLTNAFESAITDLDLDNNELLKQAFGDTAKMAEGKLLSSLELLRTKLREVTDPEQIALFREQITKIEDALSGEFSKGFTTDFESVVRSYQLQLTYEKKIAEAKKAGSKATASEIDEYTAYMQKYQEDTKRGLVGAGVTTFVSGLAEAAEQMKNLADLSGDVDLSNAAEQIGAVAQNLGAAAQGFAQGGWIGAIIGGVTDLIGQAIGSAAQNKAEIAELAQNTKDFQNAVELLNLTLDDTDWGTPFGVDSFGAATEAIKTYAEATVKYREKIDESMQEPLYTDEFVGLGKLIGGAFTEGSSSREATREYLSLMDSYQKGYTSLQGMAIKTRDRSGFANVIWGAKDEYTALKDLAPQIWGTDGAFSAEKAQAFLDTNTQISSEQRKQIENVIDLKEKADEAKEVFDDYLSATFGELGTGAIDAVTDAIINGTDAWENYGDSAASVMRKLVEEIAYMLFMAKDLENLQTKLEGIYGDEGMTIEQKEDAAQKALADYYAASGDNLKAMQGFLEEQDKKYEEQGMDLYKEDDTQGQARAGDITSIQEEAPGSIDGKLTALQITSSQTAVNTSLLVDGQFSLIAGVAELRDGMDMLNYYAKNTYSEVKLIRESTDQLGAIATSVAAVATNTKNL